MSASEDAHGITRGGKPAGPGKKYHLAWLFINGHRIRVVTWDGTRSVDWPILVASLRAEGDIPSTGEVLFCRLHDPEHGLNWFDIPLPLCAALILWAEDHRTYRAVVEEVERRSLGQVSRDDIDKFVPTIGRA